MRQTLAIVFVFVCAITLSGCADGKFGIFGERIDPVKIDETSNEPIVTALQGNIPTGGIPIAEKYTFVGYLKESAADPTNNNKAVALLKSGIVLSNRLCSLWFEQIGQAQARAGATSDDISSFGALTSTILGLANTDSKAIAAVSGTFLFGKQIISSDQANFIVAPDLGATKSAITGKRLVQANGLVADAEAKNIDYWWTLRNLIDYDDQCSHLAVKNFVSDAVAKSDPSKSQPGSGGQNSNTQADTSADQGVVVSTGHALAGLFKASTPDLTAGEVASVYGLTVGQVDAQTAANLLDPLVKRGLFNSGGAPILATGVTVDTLKMVLATFDNSGALKRAFAKATSKTTAKS
ncbi:MAG: hypothetical protein EPO08_07840 [Rhodospirillaceae bacterium]|nr:MAG: hypothetical protein EPO08_07840 [Rhodospirillaceae bacterium]